MQKTSGEVVWGIFLHLFTDDSSRMGYVFPIKFKHSAELALSQVIQEVADSDGLSCRTTRCDGGGNFKGRFKQLTIDLGGNKVVAVALTNLSGKQSLSQDVASSSVSFGPECWALLIFLPHFGLRPSRRR